MDLPILAWTFHINVIIEHVAICVWLFSLSMVFPRVIHSYIPCNLASVNLPHALLPELPMTSIPQFPNFMAFLNPWSVTGGNLPLRIFPPWLLP